METNGLGEEEFDFSDLNEDEDPTENSSEDDTTSSHNKSNWKKLAESKKTLEKELKEAREELSKFKGVKSTTDSNSTEEIISFYQKNKDALDFKDKILETMDKYGMNRDMAWKFVKMENPGESESKTDFNLSQRTVLSKNIMDITADEALNLPKDKKREWRKAHGFG